MCNYTQDLPSIPIKKKSYFYQADVDIDIHAYLYRLLILIQIDLVLPPTTKSLRRRKKKLFPQLFLNVSCAFIQTAQDVMLDVCILFAFFYVCISFWMCFCLSLCLFFELCPLSSTYVAIAAAERMKHSTSHTQSNQKKKKKM